MIDVDLSAEVKSDKFKKYWIKIKLAYLGILIFSFLYGLVVFALVYSGIFTSMDFLQEKEIVELAVLLRNIFVGISLLTICAAIIVGYILARRVGKGFPQSSSSIDSPIAPNLTSYFIYIIVVILILDSVGLYGLVIYVVSQELHWSVIIISLSFVFKLLYLPSKNRFIALMKKYQKPM